jgi:hypothetical protein
VIAAPIVQPGTASCDDTAEKTLEVAKVGDDFLVLCWLHPVDRFDAPVGSADSNQDVIADCSHGVRHSARNDECFARANWIDSSAYGHGSLAADREKQVIPWMDMRTKFLAASQPYDVRTEEPVRNQCVPRRRRIDQANHSRGQVN